MANITTTITNGHIESLIDYVLDVKPYHVKLAGGVEEYVFHEDNLNVHIEENHETMVVMGPDYINASNSIERKVWQNVSPRPLSTTSGTRIVQSDGNRRVYSIPAIMYHKKGSQTGNVFTGVASTATTEIPGLNIGVFDQRAFFPDDGEIVSVKVNGVEVEADIDYVVSRGAFSFILDGTARTWKQHNLSSISAIPAKSGQYTFNDVARKFGRVIDITANQAGAYEEWTLTYATETTVNVVGSISGNIGIATFGIPFVHASISFTYLENDGEESIAVMQPDDEFVLTPADKICVHVGAVDQTWTLISVGSFYKVFGSVSGWMPDAYVGEWYDNGEIAFKIPKLEPWIYVNGVSTDTAALTDKSITVVSELLMLDGSFALDGEENLDGVSSNSISLDAVPCVYTIKFREGTPTAGAVHSASVFNNVRGYLPGLENETSWIDKWLAIKTEGNWIAGDEIKIVLAPRGLQTWFGGYDESPYEWTLYDMGTAERPIPKDMLQEYFPLYHSKDAVIVLGSPLLLDDSFALDDSEILDGVVSLVDGDAVEIEKAQNEYVRLRFGSGGALHDSLGAEEGWIPLEYRPNVPFPDFATSIEAYLATDPNTKVFTITQPNVNDKPGLASIEFDQTFFGDFITSDTTMTFQFHQADNYGPKVGVNFSEELHIQVNIIPWDLFLDGSFDLDGSEELDGMQNGGV